MSTTALRHLKYGVRLQETRRNAQPARCIHGAPMDPESDQTPKTGYGSTRLCGPAILGRRTVSQTHWSQVHFCRFPRDVCTIPRCSELSLTARRLSSTELDSVEPGCTASLSRGLHHIDRYSWAQNAAKPAPSIHPWRGSSEGRTGPSSVSFLQKAVCDFVVTQVFLKAACAEAVSRREKGGV